MSLDTGSLCLPNFKMAWVIFAHRPNLQLDLIHRIFQLREILRVLQFTL